jgi:hypothetical protein
MATVLDRVEERRRAVQLARHHREAEACRSRRSTSDSAAPPATVKAYFYDPTGEKGKAVKARFARGDWPAPGTVTALNGKGDAYAYGKNCHPGAIAPRMDARARATRWAPGRTATAHHPRLYASRVTRSRRRPSSCAEADTVQSSGCVWACVPCA